MPPLTKKDPLSDLIATLEKKQEAIQEIVGKIALVADDLDPDIEDKVLKSLVDKVAHALALHVEHDVLANFFQNQPSSSNFDKVVAFLKSKNNVPQTREEIIKGTGVSAGSLSIMIYGTRKNIFVAEKTGEGKKLAWKLRNGTTGAD